MYVFYFAAIPPSFEDVPRTTNVVRNTPTQLTCPFELGNLRTTLTPYSISWEESMGGGMFPMEVMNTDQLSPDNTMLTVSIESFNDSRIFQCVFDLSRCSNATLLCPPVRYRGPIEQFQVFGKSIFYLIAITVDVYF